MITTPPDLAALAARARGLVQAGSTSPRAILGITGPPGAGKTTLVERLLAQLCPDPPAGLAPDHWVAHLPMDGFHLADVELKRLGRRQAKGAPDTFDAAGYAHALRRLRADRDDVVYVPAFERTLEQPIAASVPIGRSARLVLTEGNYLLLRSGPWGSVRPLLDEVWYCELDRSERQRRLVARHAEFGKSQTDALAWTNGSDEANAAAVAATRALADLVVVFGAEGSSSPGDSLGREG